MPREMALEHYPHLIDREMEAQRGQGIRPSSHSLSWQSWDTKPGFCPKHSAQMGMKGSWCPETPSASDLACEPESPRSPSPPGTGGLRITPHPPSHAPLLPPAIAAHLQRWKNQCGCFCQAGSSQLVQQVQLAMKGELLGAPSPRVVSEAACPTPCTN